MQQHKVNKNGEKEYKTRTGWYNDTDKQTKNDYDWKLSQNMFSAIENYNIKHQTAISIAKM